MLLLIRQIFLSALISSLLIAPAWAVNVYVRDGGTGDGTAWNNALDNLPDPMTRGNVYYLADGAYGSQTFNDARSGTTYIYIKKATESAHGSDTGWLTAYGDGVATFTSWSFTSATGYWDIDGVVGQWASDIPGYVAYGIKINNTSGKLINMSSTDGGVDYVNISHVEAAFTNTPRTGTWTLSMQIFYGYGGNWNISRCWFHDAGSVVFMPIGADDIVIEYSVLERNGHEKVAMGTSTHSEISMMHPDADRITWRYNYIRDWRSTGGLVLYDLNNDVSFYGNVFQDTGYWAVPDEANDSNGVITGRTAGSYADIYVYNNTFVDLRYGARVLGMGSFSGDQITKNNIFYDCHLYASGNNIAVTIGGTHDYNWFYLSGTQSETNIQNGTGDPFANRTGNDFHLTAATDAAVSTTYDTDMDGVTRGGDGTWDRGALEYAGGDGGSPGNISAFTGVPSITLINLSWTNPANTDFSGTMIRSSTTSSPADSTAGTLVADQTAAASSTDSYSDTGLTANTLYYYTGFAYDDSGNFAGGTQLSVTTDPAVQTIITGAGVDFSGDFQ